MKRLLSTLTLALILAGCSTVESSLNYTEGTRALSAGQYDLAIDHFKKAVELDPNISRNQNNLAAAYFEKGQIRNGWPHVRRAVMLDLRNQAAQRNFSRYFRALIDKGMVKKGYSQTVIRTNLGTPDRILERGEETIWQYGIVGLRFKNGQMADYDFVLIQ